MLTPAGSGSWNRVFGFKTQSLFSLADYELFYLLKSRVVLFAQISRHHFA